MVSGYIINVVQGWASDSQKGISHMTVSDVSDARNSEIVRNCQHIISIIEKVYTSLFIIAYKGQQNHE